MVLINWSHLPVDSLDGVTSSELSLITELSTKAHQDDAELHEFINLLTNHGGIGELPELPVEEVTFNLDAAELASLPKTTLEQMRRHGEAFEVFVREQTLEDCATMESWNLNEYLRYYYFGLKKQNGEPYSPASLVCIRAGIQRFLHLIKKRTVNMVAGEDFESSNRMLRVKVRQFHNAGGVTGQYEPIQEGDLLRIREYFDGSTSEKLQDEVLFTILYVFGERDQEHLKFLRSKGTLQGKTDADGNPYLALAPLPTKNQSADPARCKDDTGKQSRLYGKQRELVLRYMLLLPSDIKDDSFFPKPLANDNTTGSLRFSNKQVRGINWMASFMQQLSRKCHLSRIYSNHCIRVTRIADLRDAGYQLNDIMCITGQKSERTVRRYLSRKRDRAVHAASTAISKALEKPESSPERKQLAIASTTAEVAIRGAETTRAGLEVRQEVHLTSERVDPARFFEKCHFHSCTFQF